ncbi:hypothetical protein C8F04DRAFT_1199607 [Mycena alexandri]|uniref:Uncharacterized protein n=1 Tax=Mycena alexandri TaxID=1745969 RepID=A0AAD6WRA1_9AGAR|nr:hypothetical protein C8F04DRAFT_1199607 [Mycena alexandri]
MAPYPFSPQNGGFWTFSSPLDVENGILFLLHRIPVQINVEWCKLWTWSSVKRKFQPKDHRGSNTCCSRAPYLKADEQYSMKPQRSTEQMQQPEYNKLFKGTKFHFHTETVTAKSTACFGHLKSIRIEHQVHLEQRHQCSPKGPRPWDAKALTRPWPRAWKNLAGHSDLGFFTEKISNFEVFASLAVHIYHLAAPWALGAGNYKGNRGAYTSLIGLSESAGGPCFSVLNFFWATAKLPLNAWEIFTKALEVPLTQGLGLNKALVSASPDPKALRTITQGANIGAIVISATNPQPNGTRCVLGLYLQIIM